MEAGDKYEAVNIAIDRMPGSDLPFYHVSTAKLSLLSLSTFGLYTLFWFYKNWAQIGQRSEPDIRPFWRGLFAPLFCHGLVTRVNSAAESLHLDQLPAGVIACIYLGLLFLERLPDPYWVLSLLSFIPLLAIQRKIAQIHSAIRPGLSMEGWGLRSFLVLLVGGIVSASLVVSVLLGPPTRALRASEIPASYVETLVDAGVLDAGEELKFFCSGGLYSILENGNLLTDSRVVSYETVDGQLYVAWASYQEIESIDVEYASSVYFEDTTIKVATESRGEFMLLVSGEDFRDIEFVSELQDKSGVHPNQ